MTRHWDDNLTDGSYGFESKAPAGTVQCIFNKWSIAANDRYAVRDVYGRDLCVLSVFLSGLCDRLIVNAENAGKDAEYRETVDILDR